MIDLINAIPGVYKAIAGLVGAVVAGSGATLVLVNLVGTPAQVNMNTAQITQNVAAISELREQNQQTLHELQVVVCLLTDGQDMEPLRARRFCRDQARN